MTSHGASPSLFAILLLGLGSCGSPASDGPAGGTADAAGATDAAPALTVDAAPTVEPVRFIAMGDTGTGSATQYAVGAAVAQVCEEQGCDFVLLLGDNFYDSGIESVDDPLWDSYFELPYASISDDIPFYPVLGNHDYGGNLGNDIIPIKTGGMGNEFYKGPLEVAYSDHSNKWTMPATFYTIRVGNVGIVMLDTNSIMWSNTSNGDQEAWYASAITELAGADWIFGAGHHPYRSNGVHGNAGSYESIEVADVIVPNPLTLLNGDAVKEFFDTHVCGTINMYFSGHDHNRQWIDEPKALCGAPMIVSGAGAKTTDLGVANNNALFQDASKAGFAYVMVEGPKLTLTFYDQDLNVDFTKSISLP